MIWNFFYFKSIGIHSILEALQLYKSTTDVESDVAVAVVVIVYMYIVVCGPHHLHSVDVANSYRWSSMVDVCLCVCLLVTTVSPAKMDELIRIVFWYVDSWSPGNYGGLDLVTGMGTFEGTYWDMPGSQYTHSDSQGASRVDTSCSPPLLWPVHDVVPCRTGPCCVDINLGPSI